MPVGAYKGVMAASRVVSHGVSNPSIQGRSRCPQASLHSACEGSRSGAAGLFAWVIRAHSLRHPARAAAMFRRAKLGLAPSDIRF